MDELDSTQLKLKIVELQEEKLQLMLDSSRAIKSLEKTIRDLDKKYNLVLDTIR